MNLISRLIPKSLKPISFKVQLRIYRLLAKRNLQRDLKNWKLHDYRMPAPTLVKWAVLKRYGFQNNYWIETGTFMGETTRYLSKHAKHVYSIEPQKRLAQNAVDRFRRVKNITIINGTSEDEFGNVLEKIDGSLSIWLDGHFSSGETFQGPQDTPIREELNAIKQSLKKFTTLTIFVDDFRCFGPNVDEYSSYPEKNWLIDWAKQCALDWTVEHDIFIAFKNKPM